MKRRLSTDLEELLRRHSTSGFTLREVVGTFAERGYGLLLVLLALPSAMPVPAPGYSTPFGVVLFLIGGQILLGRTTPWLPGWAMDRRISPEIGSKMLRFGIGTFARLEGLIRTRQRVVDGLKSRFRILARLGDWIRPASDWSFRRGGHLVCGGAVLVLAGLMILPLPLTNTAPAGVVFLIGVGMLEKDGPLLAFSIGLTCLAVLLYVAAFYLILHFGLQGWGELKEFLWPSRS